MPNLDGGILASRDDAVLTRRQGMNGAVMALITGKDTKAGARIEVLTSMVLDTAVVPLVLHDHEHRGTHILIFLSSEAEKTKCLVRSMLHTRYRSWWVEVTRL